MKIALEELKKTYGLLRRSHFILPQNKKVTSCH